LVTPGKQVKAAANWSSRLPWVPVRHGQWRVAVVASQVEHVSITVARADGLALESQAASPPAALRNLRQLTFGGAKIGRMYAWWIGTVSTLAGTVVGALLQAWRERLTYHRQMATRWDEYFLKALSEYLASADCAVRTLSRAFEVRAAGDGDLIERTASAEQAFETMHEKSQMVTLLAGDRDHPIRRAAREMREPLSRIRDDVRKRATSLSEQQAWDLFVSHRQARDRLISKVQSDRLDLSKD
jgi:hypothetical protein